ncbi:MAG: hypothetical protein JWO51_4817 [Rhodospirillales bacterium]|nr:hypothetical protein [Rhodospirillales bacterium]
MMVLTFDARPTARRIVIIATLAALLSAPRISLAAAVVGISLAAATPLAIEAATPADPAPTVTSHTGLVNAPEGIAIKGYDPVAYFTEGRPVPGDPQISAEFDGAVWRFTTGEHRRVFLAHPTRYEPEYGGFCAYGAAQGFKTDIDPAAFSIIGGRLYLNANLDVRTRWRADLLTAIAEADRNWAEVKEQPLLLR